MTSGRQGTDWTQRARFSSLADQFDALNVDSLEQDAELEKLAQFSVAAKYLDFVRRPSEFTTPVSLQYPKWKRLELEKKLDPDSVEEIMQINVCSLRHYFYTSPISCPLRVYCIYIFTVYMTARLDSMWIPNSLYEHTLYRWKQALVSSNDFGLFENFTNLRDRASAIDYGSTEAALPRCILLDKLNEPRKDLIECMGALLNFTALIGSPVATINELFLFGTILFLTCVWALILFAINNLDNPDFRLDVFTFLLDPLLEKRRIRFQAHDFRDNLIVTGYKSRLAFAHRHVEPIAGANKSPIANPAHLTVAGYKKIIKTGLTCTFLLYVGSTAIGLLLAGNILYFELLNRVEHRNEAKFCQAWHPDAISIDRPNPLPAYRKELVNGVMVMPETATVARELSNLFNFRTYHSLLEFIIIYVTTAYQICLYITIMVLIRCAHFIWLRQIIAQLKCVERMMGASVHERGESAGQLTRGRIEEALLQTYVNYHLFRRSMRCQREFNSILVRYFSLVIVAGIALCFLAMIGSNGTSVWVICAMLVFILLLLHLFGYLAMSSTSNLTIFSVEINRVMVQTAKCQMEASPIVSLWRRQIMSQDEIQHAFGIQILGIEISYSNLVQLDSYVLGGFLFLLKSFLNK